jgi:hypothetical protein
MQGNILALTSITLGTSATLQGRALARNGTVTLDTDAVTACTGGTTPGFVVGAPPVVVASSPVQTPTLSEWAMILLATLVAVAGYGALHRRAKG